MANLISDFERDCKAADVAPTAALRAGGVHPSLWSKWKTRGVSPTVRNFEAALRGLESLKRSTKARDR